MSSSQPAVTFGELVGLDIGERGDGRATVTLDASTPHMNGHGTVHGGAIATLCDTVMGVALAASGVKAPVTVELRVTYLAPAREGVLTAEAEVRKRGKRILVVEAEVAQDGETVALASGTFTDVS